MRSVGFLAHDQPTDGRVRPAGGYLRKEDADLLVAQLVVERISQKLIRALPPNSSIRVNVPITRCRSRKKLPALEPSGARYFPPSDPAWQEIHARSIRSLQIRAKMTLKAWRRTA